MSESDWSYINDKWGHDSDGMPNFMNDASFYNDYKKPSYKSNADMGGNRTEKEYYENGGLKSEKKYYQHKIVSDIEYFENGNRKQQILFSYSKRPQGAGNIESLRSYYENGNIEYESINLLGKETGYSIWNENGFIDVEVDLKSKLISNYDDIGVKKSEGQFSLNSNKDTKKEGLWTFWLTVDDDHFIDHYTQYYENDKREGEFCAFDEHGRIREKGMYRDDKWHGKWQQFDEKMMILKDHFYKEGKLVVKNPQYE